MDKDSGLIHDVTVATELLDDEERVVYGDAGYQVLQKREEMRDKTWSVALPRDRGSAANCWRGSRAIGLLDGVC